MTKEHFLGKAVMDLINNGVTLRIDKRKNNSKYAYNYFDVPKKSRKPVLQMVNFTDDSSSMFEIFIHEYCHFLQWKEGSPLWDSGYDAGVYFDKWLEGKHDTCTIDYVRNIQKMELDCDKRVLKIIKDNKLPVNVNSYIKESNSYIWSYNIMFENRRFYNFNVYDDIILDTVPTSHLSFDDIGSYTPQYKEKLLKSFDK